MQRLGPMTTGSVAFMEDPRRDAESHENLQQAGSASVEQTFSLTAVVEQYETSLLRYVAQLIGAASEEVEDVVQDTFLRLHHQVTKHGEGSVQRLSSWLFRVAHNLAMDAGRSRKRRAALQKRVLADPALNPVELAGTRSPGQELARQEACSIAVAELQTLPEEQKTVLLLKIMQGFTLREISEVTGLKMGTVNYRLTQGLRELSQRLKTRGAI